MRGRALTNPGLCGFALIAALLLGGAAPPAEPCAATPETVGRLPHVAPRLHSGSELDVLAVGSLTLTNPKPLTPQDGFPFQMAAALRRMMPGASVEVTLRGGRGLTAQDMLALMREAFAQRAYQLVIWQTGSVDAVHQVPSAQFERVLRDGAALIARSGADLVLVDTQYIRRLSTRLNLAPYEDAMRRVATLPGVALLPRYDLMRGWAADGTLDLERVPPAGRKQAMGQLQACLGSTLARMVASGALK